MQAKAVYIHIPFCAHKCFYCDFATYTAKNQPIDAYLDALEQEMSAMLAVEPAAAPIETIFVGGGTPTVLTAAQLTRFLNIVERHFPQRAAQLEFTMEANPGTVDAEKLAVMRAGGVNRLSFGAQSFNEQLLTAIGRDHDAEAVLHSLEEAKRAGFTNVSLDLMFGLPQQTVKHMQSTLDVALDLGIQHFSAYALKVEQNTRFFTLQQQGKLPLPSDDEEYDMYQLVRQRMREAGYFQYEISNFSQKGYESKHNLTYWFNEPYYGFGVGAHAYTNGKRYANARGVKQYIQTLAGGLLPRVEQYEVTRQEDIENTMMLGLRLAEGVSFARFRQRFETELTDVYGAEIAALVQKGWLVRTPKGVRLTENGLLWGNEVFARFLSY